MDTTPTTELRLALTIPEAAAALGCSARHVYDLIDEEGLPFVLLGKVKRVPVSGLQAWIDARTQAN